MNVLRLGFAGTPELAAAILDPLLSRSAHRVAAVYTRPDRPAGRGRKPRPTPVKQLAQRAGLPVREAGSARELRADPLLPELDLLLVVAYGVILPPEVLALPRLGCVNVHFSLLPRGRGAAPIQRAILAGDTETGVSLMQMDAGLDTGPILDQRRCPILPQDTAMTLGERLLPLATESLLECLDRLAAGGLVARPQDESLATYAPKISKQEARLDWQRSAAELERCVRAFNPSPVAWTELGGFTLRIWEAKAFPCEDARAAPGTILACGKTGIDVAAADGQLRIQVLQPPGGRRMSASEFLNGHPDFARHARLGGRSLQN